MSIITLTKTKCKDFKTWFIRLSFFKKLILIFTINTILILIVMNVLMEILFSKVNDSISVISESQTNEYIQLSNSLVGISEANALVKFLSIFADYIQQVDSTIHFFRQNSNIYVSQLSSTPPYNPPIVNNYTGALNFNKPVIYFFNNQSTFHNQPYIDLLLSSMFGKSDSKQIKRMNVIYQSLSNPSDIFARTIPGTNDFYIPSVEQINSRFANLTIDYSTMSQLYNDTLSISTITNSTPPSQLFAIRTVQQLGNFRILMEIQIVQEALDKFLNNIYYYPSTEIVFIKVLSVSPPTYQVINHNYSEFDLTHSFTHGFHQYANSKGQIVNGYSIAIGQSFLIGHSPQIILNHDLMMMNDTTGSFRLVLLVTKSQLSTPNSFMSQFLSKQSIVLNYVIYFWSFVILLATIGLSIVTGNYIFFNLKTLSQKLQQYIKQPSLIHKIIFDLKQLSSTGIIKKLIDNIIIIIQKIEQRKKVNKNKSIQPMVYPLNRADEEFSKKHGLGDQRKWQEFKNIILNAKREKQKREKQKQLIDKQKQKLKNKTELRNEDSRKQLFLEDKKAYKNQNYVQNLNQLSPDNKQLSLKQYMDLNRHKSVNNANFHQIIVSKRDNMQKSKQI